MIYQDGLMSFSQVLKQGNLHKFTETILASSTTLNGSILDSTTMEKFPFPELSTTSQLVTNAKEEVEESSNQGLT